MDLDAKLSMSLDQLIKTDTATKTAVKSSRFRGRHRRPATSGASSKVKKDNIKQTGNKQQPQQKKKNNIVKKLIKKDTDVEMKADNRRPNKVSSKKVILTTKSEAQKVAMKDRRKVRITNIPYDVTWRDVKDAFAKVAKVNHCNVEKGEATIVFESHQDALKAISTYNGGNMNGRVIKVAFDSN
jgi:RNA recognition motif. (a.k.a. RRM, RBD, or RNP domain)